MVREVRDLAKGMGVSFAKVGRSVNGVAGYFADWELIAFGLAFSSFDFICLFIFFLHLDLLICGFSLLWVYPF